MIRAELIVFEDVLQCVYAKNSNCDAILTNNNDLYNPDIKLLRCK